MRSVLYRRIAMVIKNGQQSGYIMNRRFVDCRPVGRRCHMERVVARWRRPVASGEALVMLHRAMSSVCIASNVVIKMACDGGAFVRCRRLFHLA